MLIASSTSSAVQQPFADVSRSIPFAVDSRQFDRTDTSIAAAIEILRHADISEDGMLTAEEARALELVYRRYAPVVARVAAAILRNAADAEDVAQDVFLNLPKALRRYQPGNFQAWLKAVTARTVLMRMRRQRREAEIQTSLAAGVDDSYRFDGEVYADADRVQLAVQRLPESLRNVVELRLLVGLPHSEIGQLLGLTRNACEVRLCRALKQLRALIGEPVGAELRASS
jgi:RNA polymerase sigma-70 factor (ECF subfamily)